MIKLAKVNKILKPLKVFLYGPTGSGKTYSSLKIANGIVQGIRNCTEEEAYQHIVVIDTEYGRASLYAGVGEFNYLEIAAPYNPDKLINMIHDLNDMPEIDVIIVDSLSHFWSKEGGILDQKTKADMNGGNSYTNWNVYTAKFNTMIDTLLNSPKQIIMTARAKTDVVITENAKGKMEPKVYGLKPDIREGFDYECDATFNVDKETHTLLVEKIIPGMELIYDPATPNLGKLLHKLVTENATARVRDEVELAASIRKISAENNLVQYVMLQLSGRKLDALSLDELIKLEKDIIAEVKKKQIKR